MAKSENETQPLSDTDLSEVVGGIDVNIGEINTVVSTGEGNSGVLGNLLHIVLQSLKPRPRG